MLKTYIYKKPKSDKYFMVVVPKDRMVNEKNLEYFIGYKGLKKEDAESVKKLTLC